MKFPRASAERLSLALAAASMIAAIASASAASMHVSARPFVPEDLVATYTRYLAFPGSEDTCPETITHRAFKVGPRGNTDISYLIPHASVLHDGIPCEGKNATLVYTADDALKNPRIIGVLESLFAISASFCLVSLSLDLSVE
jgi:hypothetical protein